MEQHSASGNYESENQDVNREGFEREQILREMIRHEDELRDDRLGYLLTLNGFLFAALAIVWNGDDGAAMAFVVMLSIFGMVTGFSARAAQNISQTAVSNLREMAPDANPPIMGVTGHEPLDRRVGALSQAFAPWTVLPLLFIVGWPMVGLVGIVTVIT